MPELWPFAPNWRSPVSVDLEYRTDVVVSRSGREQRRSLRQSPRRRVEFAVTLGDEDRRALHRLMVTGQDQEWSLADPVRSIRTSVAAVMGADTLSVDSVPGWLRVGAKLLAGDIEAEVESVSAEASTVTLTDTLDDAVPAGTKLRPLLEGLINADLRAIHRTSATAEFSFAFDVNPGSEAEDASGPSYWLCGGREVFVRRGNWANPVESIFNWPRDIGDFGYGRIASESVTDFGSTVRRAIFVSLNRADAQDIAQFFSRQRGRRGEFLMPTWFNDLPLDAALVEGDDELRVTGPETAAAFDEHTVYQALAVILRDGRRLFREIEGIALDGSTSVITVAEPWLSNVATDEVTMVCWLPVVRFATDKLTIEHLTSTVAQVAVPVQTLEYLAAEQVHSIDGAGQYMLEVWGEETALEFGDGLDLLVNTYYPEAVE